MRARSLGTVLVLLGTPLIALVLLCWAAAGIWGAALGFIAGLAISAGLLISVEKRLLSRLRAKPVAPGPVSYSFERARALLRAPEARLWSYPDPSIQAIVLSGRKGLPTVVLSEGALRRLNESHLRKLFAEALISAQAPNLSTRSFAAAWLLLLEHLMPAQGPARPAGIFRLVVLYPYLLLARKHAYGSTQTHDEAARRASWLPVSIRSLCLVRADRGR